MNLFTLSSGTLGGEGNRQVCPSFDLIQPSGKPHIFMFRFDSRIPVTSDALNQRRQKDHQHRSVAKDIALKEYHLKRSQETYLLVAFIFPSGRAGNATEGW